MLPDISILHVRTRKRGFTLTEIAIVLGIIGTILGTIWVAASNVSTNQKVSKATSELLTISQNIQNIYAMRHTMTTGGDNTITLMNMGVFPADMIVGGQPVSPWGTPVEIYGAWPDNTHFIIEFDGQDRGRTSIASKYCAPLLMENYSQTSQTAGGNDVERRPGEWLAYNVTDPEGWFSACTTASFVYSTM